MNPVNKWNGGVILLMANNTDISRTSSMDILRRIFGDKWKFLTICHLFNGPMRFGELQYFLDSITKKVLTENLRELEQLGIIYRIIYPGSTTRVEYALTKLGKTLRPIIQSCNSWCLHYSHEYRQGLVNSGKTEVEAFLEMQE